MGKRITDLPEGTLEAGDYIVADREDGATKKVPLHDTLSAYVTGEGLATALEPYATEAFVHDAVDTETEQLTRTASGTVATATTAYAGAALRSVAVKGRSVQDGTPTPDAPVAVESVEDLAVAVAGKNLIIGEFEGLFLNGSTQKVATSAGAHTYVARVPRETAVTLSIKGGNRCVIGGIASPTIKSGDSFSPIANRGTISDYTYTFNTGANAYVALFVTTSAAEVSDVQLELGSTATAYVAPVVGTSAPLDLDGHALRSLPDGTCDEAVWTGEDGTLTQRVGYTTTAASDGVTGTVGVDVMSSTGQIADGADVIYKLAAPLTHALPTSQLPDAPAADMAVWAECEPSTEVEVGYRESIQLAVDEIREAIASIV